jgi:hypothetical protein
MGIDYTVVITQPWYYDIPTPAQVIEMVKAILEMDLVSVEEETPGPLGPLKTIVEIGDKRITLIGKKEVDERLIKEIEKWDGKTQPFCIHFPMVSPKLEALLFAPPGIDPSSVVLQELSIIIGSKEYPSVMLGETFFNEFFLTHFSIEINMRGSPWEHKEYIAKLQEEPLMKEIIKRLESILGKELRIRPSVSF